MLREIQKETGSQISCSYLEAFTRFLPPISNSASANMGIYPTQPSFRQGILITAVGLLFYSLVRVVYNVFFHPLSRFPGPLGAACTRWWLAYMELGRGVSLSTLRAELHQKYGTHPLVAPLIVVLMLGLGDIVRIAPNEVMARLICGVETHEYSRPSFLAAPLCKTDGVQ
jgi:hypothetical protein